MFRCQRTPIFLASCFAVGLLLPAPARAGLTALITTNTTSIAGQSGYIDLQFNALSGAALDTVIAFDFATDGALGGCPGTCSGSFGDASGDLLTTVTIGNGAVDNSGVNDFNEGLTFGTFTQFILTIPTPTAGGTADSTFTRGRGLSRHGRVFRQRRRHPPPVGRRAWALRYFHSGPERRGFAPHLPGQHE